MLLLASRLAVKVRCSMHNRAQVALTRLTHHEEPFEEETIPDYGHSDFYSVAPGELMANGRYSIISKLGWGRTSTVWLAKDLNQWPWQSSRYVSVKIHNCDMDRNSRQEERAISDCLSNADPNHPGYGLVRKPVDHFELQGTGGTHLCNVYEPLRETLDIYRRRFPNNRLPLPLLKVYTRVLLVGLDNIHATCNIVHTDLKADNILVSFEDESVLADRARQFQHTELLYKYNNISRHVFQSQNNFGALRSYFSMPILADFGSAQSVKIGAHPIQPDAYRSPEVLLGWGWTCSTDMWNLGSLIWMLASGSDLFASLHSEDGIYSAKKHLAQMFAILGPPDPTLVKEKSQTQWKWSPSLENSSGQFCEDACSFYGGPFFDPTSGEFLHMNTVSPRRDLYELATFLTDDGRTSFSDFVSKILRWIPEERFSARDLLDHPWLRTKAAQKQSDTSALP